MRINNQDKLYIGNEYNYLTSSAANDLNISHNRNLTFSSWIAGVVKTNVTIEEGGNVGIGTASPDDKLHVNGDIVIGPSDNVIGDSVYSYIRPKHAGAAIKMGTNNNTWDRNLHLGHYDNNGDFTEKVSIVSQTGNVGIGTTDPDFKLTVDNGIGNKGLKVIAGNNGDENESVIEAWNWKINGSDPDLLFKVRGDGNVGIGTATPITPLTIKSSAVSSTDSAFSIVSAANSSEPIIKIAEKSSEGCRLHMYDGGVEEIAFYTDGTDNFINAGNLGIGTTTPDAKLEVSGGSAMITSNGPVLILKDLDGGDVNTQTGYISYRDNGNVERGWVGFGSEGSKDFGIYNKIDGGILFGTGNTGEKARITPDGAFRLTGGLTPAEGGSDYGNQFVQWCDNNGHANIAAFDIQFKTGQNDNRTDSMYISEDGNVGIGTTNPQHKLQVAGNVLVGSNSNITPSNTGLGQIMIDCVGYNGYVALDEEAMHIGHNSTVRDLRLGTNETTNLTIKPYGSVGIGTTIPQSNLDIVDDYAASTRIWAKTDSALGSGLVGAWTQWGVKHQPGADHVYGTSDDNPDYSFSWGIDSTETSGSGNDEMPRFKLDYTYQGWSKPGDSDKTLMSFEPNGNIGIDAANPREKLEINDGRLLVTQYETPSGSSAAPVIAATFFARRQLSSNGSRHGCGIDIMTMGHGEHTSPAIRFYDSAADGDYDGTTVGDNNWIIGADDTDVSSFKLSYGGGQNTVKPNSIVNATSRLSIDGPTGVATFSGPLSIAEAIRHTGDTNTYFGFPNTDQFSVVTNGSTRLQITGTATTVNNQLRAQGGMTIATNEDNDTPELTLKRYSSTNEEGNDDICDIRVGDSTLSFYINNDDDADAGSYHFYKMAGGSQTYAKLHAGTVDIQGYITHGGDSNTYFGFINNDQWALVTGGTERIGVTNSAINLRQNTGITGTLDVSSDLTVQGDLTVNGDLVTLNTTNLSIEDKVIQVAKNATTDTQADESGIAFGNSAQLLYDGDTDTLYVKDCTGLNGSSIKTNSITATQIAANAVGSSELADNAVDTAAVANKAITAAKIADNTIGTGQIAASGVGTSELGAKVVTGAKIADNTITAGQIAANAVGSSELADNAVDTAAVANKAITGAKIADNTIGTGQIAASGVGTSELGAKVVTGAKIADNTITAGQIAANAVGSSELADNAVDTAAVANKAITGAKIADNTIGAGQIAANAVGSSEIATNAVGSSEIATDAVGSSEIAANAVGASELNVSGNGTSGQVLTSDGDGTFSWTNKTVDTDTNTQLTSAQISAMGFIKTDTNTQRTDAEIRSVISGEGYLTTLPTGTITGASVSGDTLTLNKQGGGSVSFTATNTSGGTSGGSTNAVEKTGAQTMQGPLSITGTNSSNQSLIAAGDVIAMNSASDERLKTNILKIDSALEKVCSLEGFTFDWNQEAKQFGIDSPNSEVGLSAQATEKVVPEAVKTFDNSDYKYINYEKLVPLLVEAIKDLKSEIQELKNNCGCNK